MIIILITHFWPDVQYVKQYAAGGLFGQHKMMQKS